MKNFRPAELTEKFAELLLFKEDASPTSVTSRAALDEVNIVLLTKCNLKCVWCHREEEHYKNSGYLEKEIDYSAILKLLPTLKGFRSIHWAGLAEPLLYNKIYDLSSEARKYVDNVKITTNGTCLSKAVVRRIVDSGITEIEVSLDGFDGEVNKRYRGSDEHQVIPFLEYLSAISNIPLQINSVVSSVNYDGLFDAVDKLKGASNITCLHAIPIFMTKHMQELGIQEVSDEQLYALLSHWESRIRHYGLDWKLSPSPDGSFKDPVISMKRRHNLCFTVYESPYINVYGDLVPCGRLQHIGLDNVFELGFDAAWNGPKSVAWREQQLKGNYGELCQRECHMRNTCVG